ncbi:CD63 antigen-like isoform X2 [Choristoneura fumiferana]|uniref:CD63 antigen-like isoform X2 n=1 Tax=Choristoneura fumiferana TaxID=7141 RepID=UPI003D158A87
MGCGTSFVKYVLFFFNLLFALVGIAMVAIGVAVVLKWKNMSEFTAGMNIAPWLFIVIGSVVFIISFFGCCGAIRESHCMVVTYAIFLIVIIIVEVALAVCLFVYADSIKHGLKESLNKTFDNSRSLNPNPFHEIERQFSCCGKTGPGNYGLIEAATLPAECCAVGAPLCTLANAYQTGCTDILLEYYDKSHKVIGGVAIGVACVEVVGALFALCLANSIRNMDRRYA